MNPNSIDPSRVEALAARGYSLPDIGRLLGVDRNEFINQRTTTPEISDAHNRGCIRWKDIGEPKPEDVKELICAEVFALLQKREISRAQIRTELGFTHADINLALEWLECEALKIAREEDSAGVSWYRASGLPSPVADKRNGSVVIVLASERNGSNAMPLEGESRPTTSKVEAGSNPTSEYICVDCGGPRSYGSGRRCKKCFDARVQANKDAKVSARSPEPREEKPRLMGQAHTLTASLASLCGCGRSQDHLGRCGYRRAQAGGDFPAAGAVSNVKPDPRHGPTHKVLDLITVEEVMATEETLEAGARKLGMTSAQLYVRRKKDEAVDEAVERGRARYYASAPEVGLSEDPAPTPVGRPRHATVIDYVKAKALRAEGKTLPQIAKFFGVKYWTFYDRRFGDPALKAALDEGYAEFREKVPRKRERLGSRGLPVENGKSPPHKETTMDAPEKLPGSSTEVYGTIALHKEVRVRIAEMAEWPLERIAEFFQALSQIVGVPQRPMPKTVQRAWSRDFENDNFEDGTVGLTYLYLISMLHDGMEEHEKQAVWTLVLYLKRMQANAEEVKNQKQ